ncbi:MAG: DUF3084 domain-containing protein, partial [Phascolarctobacterium sp.]|nr:DUF3084 domain-containing protein [Candidatus Phascolarctobacterium caballi]
MADINYDGYKIIVMLILLGGIIAYITDVLGKRIGKAHIRFLGLRPRYNARILTVISGMFIVCLSITVMIFTSKSVRVALMGMERLAVELESLEKEKDLAEDALLHAKLDVDKQKTLIKDANIKVAEAKKKVEELNKAHEELVGEVAKLEQNTKILREGITAMREGELFYRAGEVVYASVMRGNLKHEENIIQVNWLLRMANDSALRKLGIIPTDLDSEKIPQAVVLKEETVNRVLDVLDHATNDKFFRVRTLTNVMVGEISPCNVEIFDNKLVYRNGAVIYREEYTFLKKEKDTERVMMDFLTKVNRASVEHGIVSDPITGNVGGIGAESVLKVTSQLRKAGKHFVVEAKADGDIYTGGPVRLMFN